MSTFKMLIATKLISSIVYKNGVLLFLALAFLGSFLYIDSV